MGLGAKENKLTTPLRDAWDWADPDELRGPDGCDAMLGPLLLLIVEGESALEGRCVERDKECDDCMGID